MPALLSTQGDLEKLIQKLRSLNGNIRDPRAAFMDRTKVWEIFVFEHSRNSLVIMFILCTCTRTAPHKVSDFSEKIKNQKLLTLISTVQEK